MLTDSTWVSGFAAAATLSQSGLWAQWRAVTRRQVGEHSGKNLSTYWHWGTQKGMKLTERDLCLRGGDILAGRLASRIASCWDGQCFDFSKQRWNVSKDQENSQCKGPGVESQACTEAVWLEPNVGGRGNGKRTETEVRSCRVLS